jgi:hypothetical protein
MRAFRSLLSSVAALVTLANLGAQEKAPVWIQGLLPLEAKVIETAELKTRRGNARGLVLWMLHPKRVMRQADTCDWVYGDHWYGPTRLSLVDWRNKTLINTIEIRGLYEGSDEPEHGFPIPFHVSNAYYYVPQINKNKEGVPRILNLRDLTGERVVGQFVLFEFDTCTSALTTVLGYSDRTDTAVQFQIEISEPGEKTEVVSWVPHLFREKPIRPGYWNFTWEPGHGADCWIHEQVTFDPVRRLFVDQQKITPYSDVVAPQAAKKPGGAG